MDIAVMVSAVAIVGGRLLRWVETRQPDCGLLTSRSSYVILDGDKIG